MRHHTLSVAATAFALLIVGGCSDSKPAIIKEPTPTTLRSESDIVPQKKNNIINAIVATVNDEIITLHEVNLETRLAISEAEKKKPSDDISRSKFSRMTLDHLIEKKLAEQKIRELNIHVSEEEIRQAIDDVRKQNNIPSQEALIAALAGQGLSFDQYRVQLKEQIEKLKLVSMEVRAKIQVGETEMRDYYSVNQAKYREEESYRARHIFFKTGEKAPADEIKRTMTTALMVLADAKTGKDFVELAKAYSEDPSARKDGGDLGIFKKGDMQQELETTIIEMKPGEVSELIYTKAGFHIIKLEERISGKLKPFESVKSDIEEIIYRKKSEERFSQWAKELRSKASVEIRETDGLL